MKVPFLDLQAAYRELKEEIDESVGRVLASGWYIGGQELSEFETEFAAYCGVAHCVGVANGLDALHLLLRAYDIGAGDEVIVPANTYIATWLAASYAGAMPVPVEPCARTYNIDPKRIEAAVTEKTRAIIVVHLYGQPADMDAINALRLPGTIRIIEDAAQAQGARYKGRRTGTLAQSAAFSLYPGKNLGALGDAGLIVTNDTALQERVRRLGNYGSHIKYRHEEKGFNSRLDELQAAVLRVKLRKLDEWNQRRQRIAARYLCELGDLANLQLPFLPEWAEPVWHQFVIRSPKRDELQQYLKQAGVETLIHYPVPPHLQAAYHEMEFSEGSFPITEAIHREVLSLPIGPHLSEAEASHVIATLRKFEN